MSPLRPEERFRTRRHEGVRRLHPHELELGGPRRNGLEDRARERHLHGGFLGGSGIRGGCGRLSPRYRVAGHEGCAGQVFDEIAFSRKGGADGRKPDDGGPEGPAPLFFRPQEFMKRFLKINAADNVAVALADLAAGERVEIDGGVVTLREAVARGQVCVARPLRRGERHQVRLSDRPCHDGCGGRNVDPLAQPENQPARRPHLHLYAAVYPLDIPKRDVTVQGLPAPQRADGYPQRVVDRAVGGVRQRAGAGHCRAGAPRMRLLASGRCARLHA